MLEEFRKFNASRAAQENGSAEQLGQLYAYKVSDILGDRKELALELEAKGYGWIDTVPQEVRA